MIRPPAILAALLLTCVVGCGGVAKFERYELMHAGEGLSLEQSEAIDAVLTELFGTPDEPRLPSAGGLDERLDLAMLRQSSGEVISYEPGVTQGLYGRHCARCHGVAGDGRGPTALYQHPYPRDFRRGVFKWKRTYRDAPPTRGDLHQVLRNGVAGSAMPSFRLLQDAERESLVQYVVYLAIRGQLERELVMLTADELGDEEIVSRDDALALLPALVRAWANAEQLVVEAPAPSELSTPKQIARGRELYHSQRAGCAKCHGEAGVGLHPPVSLADVDYDLWSQERLGYTRTSERERPERLAAAIRRAFPTHPAWGKQLGEPLRGGEEPIDLYRRLHQGIAGTPMPALGPVSPGGKATLTDDELWSLVAYVRSLVATGSVDPATLAQGGAL